MCTQKTTELQNTCTKTDRTKGEIDKAKIMIRNFNVHFLSTNRTTGEKISKEIDMKNRIYQQDLIGIYRILHPMAEEYTSFLKFLQILTNSLRYSQR